MKTQPTIQHAQQFLDILSTHGIVKGLGKPVPGQMCIEAVWCSVLGLPHGDDPGCVGSEVRKLKISLNDKNWSTPAARAKGLAGLGLAQIGSDQINQKAFKDLWFLRCGQQLSPLILRWLVANKNKSQDLLQLATKMEASVTTKECVAHAHAYAYAYAYNYDYDYAYGYGYDYNYDYDYDYDYDYGYTRDEWLTRIANLSTSVLIELNSPGCQWLHLVK